MLPYSRQSISQDDIDAVIDALSAPLLTGGPAVEAFEDCVARAVGARYAVAFSSGTAGLHAACAAGGVTSSDAAATSSLTFVASANCARYLGAEVRLVDVDERTWSIDLAKVPDDCDVLVIPHFAGYPVDLAGLRRRPRVVIEDAAHALGAVGPDGPVGNCARSDMCVFSFHPVKVVTSAEGGIVTTNDEGLAERLQRFRNHDMVPGSHPDEPWRYEIAGIAMNYRLSDVHAALGRSQMATLSERIEARNALADRYRVLLDDLPVELPPAAPDGCTHAWHLFPVLTPDRAGVYAGLRKAGIGVQVHYVPLHLQPAFDQTDGWDLPTTDRLYESILSLPLHPHMSHVDQDRVVELLAKVQGTST